MLTKGVTKRILPNGLTVLVKENHAWPVVAIFTYVKAGYFNEPDHLVGISHMIEHMFFKGTNRRGVGQIAAETKSLGGYLNASTIYDHTLYYTVLPSQYLSQGLDIQADALINSTFDAEELKKETEVVIQEAKRKLDTPSAVAYEKLFELAFDQHRIRRWRIGAETGLRALTRDDFLAFHKDHYRPENVVLVVAGDLDTQIAFPEIESHFGHFQRGALKKEDSPSEPAQTDIKYRFMEGEIQQAHLMLGFRAPKIFHPDSYAMEILSGLLGRGRSSRFYQNVKEAKSLVNSISSSNYTMEDLGILLVDATVAPEKLRDAESAIFEEIESAREQPFTNETLHKARTLIESIYFSSLASVSGQANILAEFEAFGDFRLADDYLIRLYDVTPEDVLRVARRYLTETNCSVLEYVPKSANLVAFEIKDISSKLAKAYAEQADSPEAVSEDRHSVPETFTFVPTTSVRQEMTQYQLKCGVKVMIKENRQLPLVSMGVFARGGRADEVHANAGITALALRTALKGTKTRTAAQLALAIERLGSNIHFSNDPDYLCYSMNILSKHFEAGLDILADVITSPIFANNELSKEKDNILAWQLRERDDMFRYPLKLLYANLFKNHPYGLSPIGDEDSIESLNREHVVAWHFEQFAADNLTVVLVGDLESEKALDLIDTRFSMLRANGTASNGRVATTSVNEIVECADERKKEQTALALGFSGPGYLDEDYYALTVLQNVLSGLGGRFFEELRSRQSLAYTVMTFLVSRLAGGAFVSYIATSPDKENVAREGLLREFEKLLSTPISQDELSQAIKYTTGTHQIALETNGAQMSQYAHNELMGKGIAGIEEFPEKIEKVATDDILRAARKYFDLDGYALGVVRGQNHDTPA